VQVIIVVLWLEAEYAAAFNINTIRSHYYWEKKAINIPYIITIG